MKKTNNAAQSNKVAASKANTTKKNNAKKIEEAVKEPRQLKKSLSEEVLAARLAEAKTRKGEVITFECTKTSNLEVGLIRTARLDKRSGFIQYRIELLEVPELPATTLENATGIVHPVDEEKDYQARRTGVLYGKGDDNQDIKVIGHYSALPKEKPVKEEAPKEKPAKKEKAPKEKKAKAPKKETPEDAAMAAAMEDMKNEGLM